MIKDIQIKLADKSVELDKRLKLAKNAWNTDSKTFYSFDKQNLILQWTFETISNRRANSLDENDLINMFDHLFYFLNEINNNNANVDISSTFLQALLDLLGSKNKQLRQVVQNCCSKILTTRFSKYLMRNFDQINKIFNHFVNELIENRPIGDRPYPNYFDNMHVVLTKYYISLKSEQNINRVYNRLCSQTFFNLINFMWICKQSTDESGRGEKIGQLTWKITKYGFFSRAHSNIYTEFVKNLPSSFSSQSNYQAALIFHTIQNDSIKNNLNFESICKNIHLIAKELYSIINSVDYKQKMVFFMFLINLVWDLKSESSATEQSDSKISSEDQTNELKLECITKLLALMDELNLFNPIDDQKNDHIFKTSIENFYKKTFHCKFNKTYSEFLISLLKIDHLILESELNLILNGLQNENNQADFVNFYLDSNVKYRQVHRMTKRLIESVKLNSNLQFPVEFYNNYGEYVENYKIDGQTCLDIWKEINDSLRSSKNETLKRELLKFLNCILSRINLINLPLHLRIESNELIETSIELLFEHMLAFDTSKMNRTIVHYLECAYSCGLIRIILARFSLTSKTANDATVSSVLTSAGYLNDLNKFLHKLNDQFKIIDKIQAMSKSAAHLEYLFFLNKLNMINVYSNLIADVKNRDVLEKTLLGKAFDIKNVDSSNCAQMQDAYENLVKMNINDVNDYNMLHQKLLVMDNLHVIAPVLKKLDKKTLARCFRNLFIIMYQSSNAELKFQIDSVNLNAVFDNAILINDLLCSFLDLIVELAKSKNAKTDKQNEDFLNHAVNLINNDQASVSDTINAIEKVSVNFNKRQTDFYVKILDHFPLEHLNQRQSFIFFHLSQRIDPTEDVNLEKILFGTYFRLFLANFIEIMPVCQFTSWLMSFFDACQKCTSIGSKELFNRIVKKSLTLLFKEENMNHLVQVTTKLIEKHHKKNVEETFDMTSLVDLTLLKIFDKVCKVQEFKTRSESYSKSLDDLMEMLIKTFTRPDLTGASFLKFYVCSILCRHVCAANIDASQSNNQPLLDRVRCMLDECSQEDKKLIKKIKKRQPAQKTFIFEAEYLKACILNYEKIARLTGAQLDPIECFKNMFTLYKHYSFDVAQTEITYEFLVNKQVNEPHADTMDDFLIRSLAQSINGLSNEQFKNALDFLSDQMNTVSDCDNPLEMLTKLTKFLKFLTCDIEIKSDLMIDFSNFIQKFLIQIPVVYTNLNSSDDQNQRTVLIELLTSIFASKNFMLPSHIVISTLQIFAFYPFESLKIDEYVKIQELVCKLLSLILMRYSKKFCKLAAIISELLTRLISLTTTFSNQNTLKEEHVQYSVKAAQDLERIISQLVAFKKHFSKLCPYIISEYFFRANTFPIHVNVKNILSNAMYNLMDLCDLHGISMLHVALPTGPRDLFKNTYSEYEKYFKYTGSV